MEKIYCCLPVFIQNCLITLKNILVYNYKYGAIPLIKPIAKVQERVLRPDFFVDHSSNIDRINDLVSYAVSKTVYYGKKGGQYSNIKTIADFKKIPILEKNVFKERVHEFNSKDISWYNCVRFKTSGTTGSPVQGFVSKSDLRKRFLIILKTMCESGFNINRPYARFVGKDVAASGPVVRKDFLNGHFFFSVSRLSKDTIYQYYYKIVSEKIEFLEGYPSTLSNLVELLKRNGLKIDCVKGVYVTAEKLSSHQRNNIENYFGCDVFDYYGSSEQSIYIYKPNGYGKYICANVTGYLEVLDSQGVSCREGNCGDMVVTSFTSRFAPLIRYRIGDRCRVHKKTRNPDGTTIYELSEIIGRDEDSFETLDGRVVSRFSLVLKFLPCQVDSSQLFLSEIENIIKVHYLSHQDISHVKFRPFEDRMKTFIGCGYKFEYKKGVRLKDNEVWKD